MIHIARKISVGLLCLSSQREAADEHHEHNQKLLHIPFVLIVANFTLLIVIARISRYKIMKNN